MTASVCSCVRILSGRYRVNRSIFCNQSWYGGVLSWAGVSCGKIVLLSYHKPEYPVKIVLLCSRSRSQQFFFFFWIEWVIVRMISSKTPIFLLPNLVELCIIISQSVIQKNWFAVFKGKVTARAHMIKMWLLLLYLLNCSSFCNQTWFYGMLLSPGVPCERRKGWGGGEDGGWLFKAKFWISFFFNNLCVSVCLSSFFFFFCSLFLFLFADFSPPNHQTSKQH